MFKTLSEGRFEYKQISVVASILIISILIDTSVIRISDFNTSQSTSTSRTIIFIIIGLIYVTGQFVLIRYLRQKTVQVIHRQTLHFDIINKITMALQCLLSIVIVFVIIQIVVRGYYSISALVATTCLSYGFSSIMMGLLARNFLSWYKTNKHPMILFYVLSTILISLNALFTAAFVTDALFSRSEVVYPHVGIVPPFLKAGSEIQLLFDMHFISSILAFIVTWIPTFLILNYYSQKIGKFKYWIIVSLPLVYFLSQFLTSFLNIFAPLFRSDPVFYGILITLLFNLSKFMGGILFGIAYFIIAHRIDVSAVVREFMIISAYGFILLFISNQSLALISGPFPPFGLATISCTGLASYMILVGIYYSAVSVSQDSNLRKLIRKLATKESRLLHDIGTAHMEREILQRVFTQSKENRDTMVADSGVESSLSEEDIKLYLKTVLDEIRDNKRNKGY
jgi:hypothetical protein